jgi:hypothetical protein
MYMKTKEEVKKSRNPSPGSLLSPPSSGGEGPLMTFVFSAQKSREQSQNVYENKGRGQEVAKPLTRLATLAALSPPQERSR